MRNKIQDLTGQKFGRLTVLKNIGKDKYNHTKYMCNCDCGNTVYALPSDLVKGRTKSCGCYQREVASKCMSKHKKSNEHIYRVWVAIRYRCENPNRADYKHYGGRGIKVCDEWQSFENFYQWSMANGYNDNLTIDRINVNGNYEPSNCRWADWETQMNNTTRNRYLTFNGVTMSMSDWSKKIKVPYRTIQWRLENEWSIERTLTTPRRKRKCVV